MRAVIQRVASSQVTVDAQEIGRIGRGLLVLLGVQAGDTLRDVEYLVNKTAGLRVFEDEQGAMNRSVVDVGGAVLVVSQFTLLGDVRRGKRPSFTGAARPEQAVSLYAEFCQRLRGQGIPVEEGQFQADMQVTLTNDGPVTILLDSHKLF